KISVNLQREYIPEWNGNREEPVGSQIKVLHRAPTLALKDELVPKPEIKFRISDTGKSEGGETIARVDNRKIVEGMVFSIENLTLEVQDGENKSKTVEIKSVRDLYSSQIPASL